jgi:hypothetical protein
MNWYRSQQTQHQSTATAIHRDWAIPIATDRRVQRLSDWLIGIIPQDDSPHLSKFWKGILKDLQSTNNHGN